MAQTENYRVLSIQSHVVSGYVGNKCASFALNLLGFDVDTLNTVQFSNHAGYPVFKGQVTSSDELLELYNGLDNKKDYTHVITGYITSVRTMAVVKAILTDLKRQNENIIYLCDPVLGDNGFLYIPAEIVPIIKNEFIPVCDIITPNQYEAELLTGITIKDEASALDALEALHVKGAKSVVITACVVDNNRTLNVCFASKRTGDRMTSLRLDSPRFDTAICGVGDLFAAVLLAWMTKSNNNLKISVEKTMSTVNSVVNKTLKHAQMNHPEAELKYSSAELELRLVQSRDEIEEPPMTLKSIALT